MGRTVKKITEAESTTAFRTTNPEWTEVFDGECTFEVIERGDLQERTLFGDKKSGNVYPLDAVPHTVYTNPDRKLYCKAAEGTTIGFDDGEP